VLVLFFDTPVLPLAIELKYWLAEHQKVYAKAIADRISSCKPPKNTTEYHEIATQIAQDTLSQC
jgi:hypothetical protein